MATELSGTTKVNINFTYAEAPDIGSASQTINETYNDAWVDGAGDNEATKVWQDTRDVSQGDVDLIDLTGNGADVNMSDIWGVLISLSELKGFAIHNNSLVEDLRVGGADNAVLIHGAAADYELVKPGGTVYKSFPKGIAIVDGVSDELKITTADVVTTTANYDIIIWGN